MEVKQKKNNSIKIAASLAVVALVAAFVWYFAVFSQDKNEVAEEPTIEVTEEATEAQQDAKEELVNNSNEKANLNEESKQDQSNAGDFNVGFSAVNQVESGLQVRVLIDKVIPESTCRLILTNGSQQVVKTSATAAFASNSTCQGFDVPSSEVSAGNWEVRVQVESQGQVKEAITNIEIT